MIIDSYLEFADGQTVSAAAGTAVAENAIDLRVGGTNASGGNNQLFLVIVVETAFASAGAALVEFRLVSDAQDPVEDDGTATVHMTTGAIPFDDLTAGRRIILGMPSSRNYERYLGLLIVTSGATTTAGKISAFLTVTPEDWAPFVEGAS